MFFDRLAALYGRMVATYADMALKAGLSCEGCPRNCCDSYFQHHTYIEWSYLWHGLKKLPEERRKVFVERAEENVRQAGACLSQGIRPRLMCPLNEGGLCVLYDYRLMICRMHGVPHLLSRPGRTGERFPGCFRCMEGLSNASEIPVMDRTPFYRELAELEMRFVGPALKQMPRVDMTLSEMIAAGPPRV